jgi:hypothetical protein
MGREGRRGNDDHTSSLTLLSLSQHKLGEPVPVLFWGEGEHPVSFRM